MNARLGIVFTSVVILATGCSRDPRVAVSGSVTFDGQPMEVGDIILEAPDGSSSAAAATIENGRYAVRILPGPKKVSIYATKATKYKDIDGAPEMRSYVPVAYNRKTTLTADVQPDTMNEINFALKSKP